MTLIIFGKSFLSHSLVTFLNQFLYRILKRVSSDHQTLISLILFPAYWWDKHLLNFSILRRLLCHPASFTLSDPPSWAAQWVARSSWTQTSKNITAKISQPFVWLLPTQRLSAVWRQRTGPGGIKLHCSSCWLQTNLFIHKRAKIRANQWAITTRTF